MSTLTKPIYKPPICSKNIRLVRAVRVWVVKEYKGDPDLHSEVTRKNLHRGRLRNPQVFPSDLHLFVMFIKSIRVIPFIQIIRMKGC